ncbi:beta-lactamase/transpeptidase-like protein [Leptodontidium sp. MPI-SDFR-AT-0119]|nr:beta-lactamase/transpeptidase-like protein [Leptodontidium sp. MPI-SDFR-AT-0119]
MATSYGGIQADCWERVLDPEQLSRALEDVQQLLDICGVPSISLGILHHGQVILRESVGFRNVEREFRADSDTKYLIGSVSKTFLAALAAIADSEGRLKLQEPFSPQLHCDPARSTIPPQATLRNILHHTSGLSNPQILYLGPMGSILHSADTFLDFATSIPMTDQGEGRLGKQWVYNNTTYGLIPLALEAAYSQGYSSLLKDKILIPLGLRNTADCATDEENVAFPYIQLASGSFRRLRNSLTDERNPHVLGVMGMRSSVNDLLTWANSVMGEGTAEDQGQSQTQSILRGVAATRKPFWTWRQGDTKTWSSCMGWTKTTMPTSRFGALSYNFAAAEHRLLEPDKYIVGNNATAGKTILQSNGTVYGSDCGLYAFPDTRSAIVVCSNGLTNGDAADWAARIMTHALFNLPRIDFLELARVEAAARRAKFEAMLAEWHRGHEPPPHTSSDLLKFVGVYSGLETTLTIRARSELDINPTSDGDNNRPTLQVVFNNVESSQRDLIFYKENTLSFFPTSRDEWLSDQMIDWDFTDSGLFYFSSDPSSEYLNSDGYSGRMSSLTWKWDENESPTVFMRVEV